MTGEEKVIEMMMTRGMLQSQAEEVFVIVKDAIEEFVPEYNFTWDRPVDEYPEVIYDILWLTVKFEVLKWIEENKPMAWFKPMFM